MRDRRTRGAARRRCRRGRIRRGRRGTRSVESAGVTEFFDRSMRLFSRLRAMAMVFVVRMREKLQGLRRSFGFRRSRTNRSSGPPRFVRNYPGWTNSDSARCASMCSYRKSSVPISPRWSGPKRSGWWFDSMTPTSTRGARNCSVSPRSTSSQPASSRSGRTRWTSTRFAQTCLAPAHSVRKQSRQRRRRRSPRTPWRRIDAWLMYPDRKHAIQPSRHRRRQRNRYGCDACDGVRTIDLPSRAFEGDAES